MKNLHLKKGEFIYFVNRRNAIECYKILLIAFDKRTQKVELGVFDCRERPDPVMQQIQVSFGHRQTLFDTTVTVNALKSDHQGVDFAVSASSLIAIESDFTRSSKISYSSKKGARHA